jgi:hypothetical protein
MLSRTDGRLISIISLQDVFVFITQLRSQQRQRLYALNVRVRIDRQHTRARGTHDRLP